ncbi:hypothetical protein ACWGBV_29995 [Streptomyces sp. NPDC055051]
MTTTEADARSAWDALEEKIPFGEDLVLPLEGREIVVKTDGFPRAGD